MGRKKLTADMFEMHTERSRKIRASMVAHVKKHVKSEEASVFLSAGVDSHACLFAALEAGKKVTTYSFTLDDRESTDFKVARRTAEIFGLKFVPVILKTDLKSIKNYLLRLYRYSKEIDVHINKSSVECLYPLFETYDKVLRANSQASILGLGGDIFFCTTRKQRKQLITGEYEAAKENYLKNRLSERAAISDVPKILVHSFSAQ
jgi:asparagine synthetase B (glutamine-hydrolysing)